jgi:hypothetical protein
LQVLELLQSSVTLHVRVIVYAWAHAPAVVTSVYVTVGVGSQVSVPVAEPVLAGKVLAVHWIVTLGGQVMAGGVLSSTVMI